jgi:hypothetical protein
MAARLTLGISGIAGAVHYLHFLARSRKNWVAETTLIFFLLQGAGWADGIDSAQAMTSAVPERSVPQTLDPIGHV